MSQVAGLRFLIKDPQACALLDLFLIEGFPQSVDTMVVRDASASKKFYDLSRFVLLFVGKPSLRVLSGCIDHRHDSFNPKYVFSHIYILIYISALF